MHDSFLEGIKFNLDHFDRYQNTYFLAGWVHGPQYQIEALRIEALNYFSHEVTQFEVRHDVNKFYDLSDDTHTGFKAILTPDEEFPALLFSVKFRGDDKFKVIQEVKNPRFDAPPPEPEKLAIPNIGINNAFPGLLVVENFYDNPDKVREYAMSLEYKSNNEYHKGARTDEKTVFPGTKEFFEAILHKKITNWEDHIFNGVFQYCTAEDALVYHTDHQSYAAVVFLTPDAPPQCGTSFFKSRHNGLMHAPTPEDCERLGKSRDELLEEMFAGNYYDKTRWDTVDVVGNVYNRMVIWDAHKVHAASEYFGNQIDNSRLFHMFFFDAE